MGRVDSEIIVPPRLLTGVAVLFWGAMSEQAVLGLGLAVLLEGRNWVKMRWDFGEKGHVGAFQLSLVLVLFGVVLEWVDGSGQYSMLRMLQWAPVYALPVELAQRYGRQDSMFLNTFFYFSRRRMLQDRREGRAVDPWRVNTGFPYILLVLVSASCSSEAYWAHAVGAVLILVACFVAVGRKRGVGWWSLVVAVPILVGVGFGILMVVMEANRRFRNQDQPNTDFFANQRGMNEYGSRLGNLGDIKQSREVMWRMWTDGKPDLLRVATYDIYDGEMWRYHFRGDGYESLTASFDAEVATKVGVGEDILEVFRQEDEARATRVNEGERVRVRGTIDTKSNTALVPSVSGFYAVGKILGDNVNSETNDMGALRLVNRDVVIDYTMWAEFGNNVQDSPPDGRDTLVTMAEREVVKRVVDELGLREIEGVSGKVARLRRYFAGEFEYSTHFETGFDGSGGSQLSAFLTKYKRGHCEYFATATAMLLRECGVPARYCVGFAVMEKKGDAWLLRGTHAHAWCRVYDDGKWLDVDLTPPGWGARDGAIGDLNVIESFRMWLKLLREDFQVWRQNDSNKGQFWAIMGGLGLLVFGWIGFRLWRARLADGVQGGGIYWDGEVRVTPLNRLERRVAKVIGERPEGMPYGRWMEGLRGVWAEEDLERVIALHQGMRFDPATEDVDGTELEALCSRLAADLKRSR